VFRKDVDFFTLILSSILIFSSSGFLNLPLNAQTETNNISAEDYDKIKNCSKDLRKKPTPVEYPTYFNCGHVSRYESGRTVRQFTLIVEENQKIPI